MTLLTYCQGLPGRDCRELVPRGRCRRCATEWDRTRRPSARDRGYGADHDRARRELARTLPTICGYCHGLIDSGDRWDAAHVVDGDPSYGLMVAHPACNQRAKRRGGS